MVNDVTGRRGFRTRAALRGELMFSFDDDWLSRQTALPAALGGILDFARRLVPPADIPGRLAANARQDPVDTVRLRNLETLRREYPHHGETQRALREACRDAHDVVRLFAASSLGAEGREVLLQLTTTAGDSCASRAVTALGAELSAAMALDLLADALAKRRFATAEACIGVLAGRGGGLSVTAFSRALVVERGRVAVAAARALGHPGLPDAQGVLLQHGIGHAEAGVRAAAARALGEIGTVEAVLPLIELGGRGGPEVRESALAAVASIQSRLQGAAPGQLSVAHGEGGTLSLAREGGELSLPGDGRG
jgi:HEAT repeat protein